MPAVINTNTTLNQVNIAQQKAVVEAEYTALVSGIQSELADVDTVRLRKKIYTKAELLAHFQSRIDAAQKTKGTRTAFHTSVAAERELDRDIGPLRMAFKAYLQSRYGKESAEMQKFGFTPAKVPQRSTVAKTGAVMKTKATRQARGTRGKKQKVLIKGEVASTHPSTAPPSAGTGLPSLAAVPTTVPAPNAVDSAKPSSPAREGS